MSESFHVVGCKAGQWVKERTAKYQWPADKLTEKEMTILFKWRQLTKTPINHLLSQCIGEMSKIIGG